MFFNKPIEKVEGPVERPLEILSITITWWKIFTHYSRLMPDRCTDIWIKELGKDFCTHMAMDTGSVC